eukprot:7498132-Pyramimonas_sp.AAC.1
MESFSLREVPRWKATVRKSGILSERHPWDINAGNHFVLRLDDPESCQSAIPGTSTPRANVAVAP